MTKNKFFMLLVMIILIVTLVGCTPNDGTHIEDNKAGFFWGIWHGWIAPISLIIGLFNKETRIYEVVNTGLGYDLGYYMAIISGFGGISIFRNKKGHKD